MVANHARGETSVTVDGKAYRLVVTLGALAEIETVLEVRGQKELQERLANAGMNDMLAIMAALMRAGGEKDITTEDVQGMDLRLGDAVQALSTALSGGVAEGNRKAVKR